MANTQPPKPVLPSTIHPFCLTALNRVLNKEIAFAMYVHSPTCESITVDYEAEPHEDCTSLYKHPRLLSGGAKYLVVDVSRGRVRKGGGVVELGLGGKGKGGGGEGVVFIQWRFEGGSIEREMAMERDYDRLRKRFKLKTHARFCGWWMLKGWDSILRYTGFESEAYRVRNGGV